MGDRLGTPWGAASFCFFVVCVLFPLRNCQVLDFVLNISCFWVDAYRRNHASSLYRALQNSEFSSGAEWKTYSKRQWFHKKYQNGFSGFVKILVLRKWFFDLEIFTSSGGRTPLPSPNRFFAFGSLSLSLSLSSRGLRPRSPMPSLYRFLRNLICISILALEY